MATAGSPVPSSSIGPLPGDPAGAADMPAFGGAGGQDAMAPEMGADVRSQLENATAQLGKWHRSIDMVLDGVKGISTNFPGTTDKAKPLAEAAQAFKKLCTEFVLDTVKQAPRQPAPMSQPVAMR